jgi:hypothetical protein
VYTVKVLLPRFDGQKHHHDDNREENGIDQMFYVQLVIASEHGIDQMR